MQSVVTGCIASFDTDMITRYGIRYITDKIVNFGNYLFNFILYDKEVFIVVGIAVFGCIGISGQAESN